MNTCSVENCTEKVKARDMCKKHYDSFMKREKRGGGYVQVGDFCKKGHKIEGENVQHYMNHGIERIRCALCTRIQKTNNLIKLGDFCIHGHQIIGDNAIWIKDQKNPEIKRVRCRECNRNRNKRYHDRHKDEPEYRERIKLQIERERIRKHESLQRAERYDKILAQEITQGSGSYTGLNYLKLNKRAERVWQPLRNMFENVRGFCYKNPTDYIDYDEENPPSKYHAFELCRDCPLLVECGRFAHAYKPVIGVWGGEVWKDGKVLNK